MKAARWEELHSNASFAHDVGDDGECPMMTAREMLDSLEAVKSVSDLKRLLRWSISVSGIDLEAIAAQGGRNSKNAIQAIRVLGGAP